MQIQPCTRLKDGREVLLRSPEAADAQALLDYMRVTSGETHFMARYPEECQATVEQETGFIEALTGHPQNFMIVAMLSGELVGGCSVMAVSGHIKTRHRGSLGISVEQKAWGGLGTAMIEAALRQMADDGDIQLLVTTGGTGFAPRDVTPEATLAVCDRLTPGIPEAMRYASMQITGRAMLSRAQAGIRKGTLILNLPGSPKAAQENLEAVLPAISHGLEMLSGRPADCAKLTD